ncbi:Uncharacterised protein [Vibrio cholerae]|nr:Uncharacterised protein [Vibrio cholerae]
MVPSKESRLWVYWHVFSLQHHIIRRNQRRLSQTR